MGQEIWQAFEDYAAMKLPVIPLCPPDHEDVFDSHREKCMSPGKRPMFKGWKEAVPPDEMQIKDWQKQVPNANIGLVMGSPSGLIAIDVDGEGGQEILNDWSQGELPATWEFTTPNQGRRLIYVYPKELILNKASQADPNQEHCECALMGEGSQTVMPPSIHPNGGKYAWVEGRDPLTFGNPSMAPQWILKAMRGKKIGLSNQGFEANSPIDTVNGPKEVLGNLGQRCPRFETNYSIQQGVGVDEDRWFRECDLLISAGAFEAAKLFSSASTKHNSHSEARLDELRVKGSHGMIRCTTFGCETQTIQTCFKGKLRYNTEGEIINSPGAFIRSKAKADPSMLLNVIKIATSKLKTGDKSAYLQADAVDAFLKLEADDPVLYAQALATLKKVGGKERQLKRAIKQNKIDRVQKDTAYLSSIGFMFDPETGEVTGMNANIYARHLLTRVELVYTAGDRFYEYDMGFWRFVDENAISRTLRDILHEYVPNYWKEPLEHKYLAALKRETPFQQGMDANRAYINLCNGMLSLDTYRLEKHDSELYSTVQLPIDYDSAATCTRFDAFLNEVFEGDRQRILVVGEMLGYCLTPETKAQKAFILHGQGSNGKSRLIEVMQNLAGAANCSSVPLSDLNSSFARYELVNKLVNIASENEVREGGFNSEYFKAIATGDQIRVERKFHEGFSYSPLCKLMFAMNALPFSKDRSHGFHRRLIIIPFEKRFEKGSEDKDLASKLKQELPGILNFALDGLKRLRTNKYTFTESEAIERALNEYKEYTEPNR